MSNQDVNSCVIDWGREAGHLLCAEGRRLHVVSILKHKEIHMQCRKEVYECN